MKIHPISLFSMIVSSFFFGLFTLPTPPNSLIEYSIVRVFYITIAIITFYVFLHNEIINAKT